MSPELHQKIRRIFDEALERPERERLLFLRQTCGSDEALFSVIARLLEAHGGSSFLDRTSPATRHFGRYVISNELGRGAMGIVYKAADPLIGRTVAIKIIQLDSLAQPDDPEFMPDRLFREARSAGRLSHPGIVTIFDVGQENNVAFVAMEYVHGPTLQQMLGSSRRLDCGKALDVLRQTASALDYAHRNGVIHRDIKPANIMLHENTAVKIADFGIAKVLSGVEHTRTGMVLGTPSYMSPEQIGAKTPDGRSDQFSLAAVAFQLLTGVEPFQADSLAALLQRILYEPPLSACALHPELPPGVDRVLHRALEKLPALRYQTCTEFILDLEKAISGAAASPPVPVREPNVPLEVAAAETGSLTPVTSAPARTTGRRNRKRPVLTFTAMVGAIALLAVLVYVSRVHLRLAEPSRRTDPAASTASASRTPPAAGIEMKQVVANQPANPVGNDAPASDAKPAPEPKQLPDDRPAHARRLYELAVRYRDAQRTPEALDLFREAARAGEVRAMVELGEILMNDADGVSADYIEALRWLNKAAEAGDPSGMVDLGGMYLLGNGIDQDPAIAATWFAKAAAAGNPTAMYNLGLLFESGEGVSEDRAHAKELFSRAAALGNQEAQRSLAKLEPKSGH